MLFQERKQTCEIIYDRLVLGLDKLFTESAGDTYEAHKTADRTKEADDTDDDSLLLFAYRFH